MTMQVEYFTFAEMYPHIVGKHPRFAYEIPEVYGEDRYNQLSRDIQVKWSQYNAVESLIKDMSYQDQKPYRYQMQKLKSEIDALVYEKNVIKNWHMVKYDAIIEAWETEAK